MRLLKENTSSSFEQVIRKVIPDVGQSSKKTLHGTSPRIEIVSSPVSRKFRLRRKLQGRKKGRISRRSKRLLKQSRILHSHRQQQKKLTLHNPALVFIAHGVETAYRIFRNSATDVDPRSLFPVTWLNPQHPKQPYSNRLLRKIPGELFSRRIRISPQ